MVEAFTKYHWNVTTSIAKIGAENERQNEGGSLQNLAHPRLARGGLGWVR